MERLTNSNEEIKSLQAKNSAYWLKVYFKLKQYEELEEQGLLLRLPCKVGDAVWGIENFECDGTLKNPPQIREMKFNHYLLDFIGKTVFLTKAEAEKALAEMG